MSRTTQQHDDPGLAADPEKCPIVRFVRWERATRTGDREAAGFARERLAALGVSVGRRDRPGSAA